MRMFTMGFRLLPVALTGMLLSGCLMMETYSDSRQGIESAEREITRVNQNSRDDAAIYISRPSPILEPIQAPAGPVWIRETVANPIEVSDLPFSHVIDMVLEGTGKVAQMGYDLDPSLKVSLVHDGTIEDAFQKLSALTNYAHSVDDQSVQWQAYLSRNYSLPVPGGNYSYMVGKKRPDDEQQNQGSGPGDAASIDNSAFDVDRNQFSNTRGEDLNPFVDATQTLQNIVGRHGLVIPSESSATILVKTTPDKMRVVDEYMTALIAELTTQVLLEVKVLQVTTENNAEVGIDWAAVKETARSQLQFVGESPLGLYTNDVPVAFSGRRVTGSGSIEALVKALEQQGQVAFVTEQRVLTRSGRVAELELADIQGYLAASRTTNTTDVGSTTELIPGILQGGYTLYSMAKVHGDQVAMVISNRSSELNPTETIGTELNFIELPRMKSNRFNLQQIVSSGTTVVAAAVRREENMSRQASPLKTGWASTSAGARHRVTDIYVLITPRIIRTI